MPTQQNQKNTYVQNISGPMTPIWKNTLKSVLDSHFKRNTTTANTSPQSSSPSATSPVKVSPAKAEYVQNLAQTSSPSTPPLQTGSTQSPLPLVNPNAGKFGTGGISAPDPQQGYKDAFNAYIASLSPSSEEMEAQKRLSSITTQNRLDYEKALQSGETLGYATGLAGEQARTAGIMEGGAADTLKAFTDRRKALTDAQKARFEFEQGLAKETRDEKRYQEERAFDEKKFEEDVRRFGLEYALKKRQEDRLASEKKDSAPSSQELKVFINKQIATPEFQALSPEEKALYIQSQGGTPYDFGY